ncbi:hypothetical protein ACIU1J_01090 [Azospirillum doebereinerae]|uniref:hypothetical protein n=1 Tax=Azospirillum doebereinerae TaxID=92933 RepID=UPI001EE5AFC3|nr:hypothetical protein [Azospirillum doebereinerae]MCG5239192.1 hypothetical protein [Azospirillum doebereinerae]
MPCRKEASTDPDAFALPDIFVREEACHLPQIDHLSIAQLRRRAAEDREDALGMNRLANTGCLAMLLADAERCEARADALETFIGGLDETIRTQLTMTEVTVTDLRSLIARCVNGIAPGPEGSEANAPAGLSSTLAASIAIALRNRHALAKV